MKPSEVLRKAMEKIDSPDKWTQYEYARVSNGDSTSFHDKNATCWCAMGALLSTVPNPDHSYLAERYLERIINSGIFTWNDAPGRTHAEIFDALHEAMTLAQSEGQ